MKADRSIQVLYENQLVGTLALADGHKAAFEYTERYFFQERNILMDYLGHLQIVYRIVEPW